jgi:hypothetical protein
LKKIGNSIANVDGAEFDAGEGIVAELAVEMLKNLEQSVLFDDPDLPKDMKDSFESQIKQHLKDLQALVANKAKNSWAMIRKDQPTQQGTGEIPTIPLEGEKKFTPGLVQRPD